MSMDTAKQNLELLLDANKGMWQFIINESIGGNAGTFEGFPCFAVNFSYDSNTGKIVEFSNRPHMDSSLYRGYFRFVVYPREEIPPMISVSYGCGNEVPVIIRGPRPTQEAIKTLNSTLVLYNDYRMREFPQTAFSGYSCYTPEGMQQQQPKAHQLN